MTGEIPDRFAPIVAATAEVCAELGAGAEFQPYGEARWLCAVRASWAPPVGHVAFVLDSELPLFAVYVVLELPTTADARDRLTQALTRANYGLLPGCFEINLDGDQLRYRSVFAPLPERPEAVEIARLMGEALEMVAAYAPAFEAVIEGADPELAINRVELE